MPGAAQAEGQERGGAEGGAARQIGQGLLAEEEVLAQSDVRLQVVMAAASVPRPVLRLIRENFPEVQPRAVARAVGRDKGSAPTRMTGGGRPLVLWLSTTGGRGRWRW